MEPAESDPQARGPCVLPVQRIPLTPWESQLFRGYRGRRRADCAHSISGSTSCSAASLTKSGSVKSKSSGFGFTRRKLESWEPEVPAMSECEYPSFPQPPTDRGRAQASTVLIGNLVDPKSRVKPEDARPRVFVALGYFL